MIYIVKYCEINWHSLHARLNRRKRRRKLKPNKKAVYKDPKDKRCLLTLDLKLFRSLVILHLRMVTENHVVSQRQVDLPQEKGSRTSSVSSYEHLSK